MQVHTCSPFAYVNAEEVTSYANLVLLLRDIYLNARETILVTILLCQKESTANDLLLCSKQAILSCRHEK